MDRAEEISHTYLYIQDEKSRKESYAPSGYITDIRSQISNNIGIREEQSQERPIVTPPTALAYSKRNIKWILQIMIFLISLKYIY